LNDKIERRAKKLASNFTQTVATHLVKSWRRWMKAKELAGPHYAIATECNRILLPDRPEIPKVSGLTSCRHP
jgi:hypothetical protein